MYEHTKSALYVIFHLNTQALTTNVSHLILHTNSGTLFKVNVYWTAEGNC
jgi:hypothetical protein